ncbi:hypothetical protein KIH39_21130 [Telmatocola sphagniphila]|uniref:Disease resistance R13L4/SHOC-2-like LRR domain-containing protein n=1 Tax=Telmatocola sphagniphila TaxID=1123043 RepID=A0A8E6B6I9_9BACT|nr:hypothetical protein [Telmatocola sphagniphila]QVL31325.1 hypothetical protein KIH39_21130 [Telmatocola sphagniphila]
MRRISALFLLFLTSCGGGNKPQAKVEIAEAPATTKAETKKLEPEKVTVKAVELSDYGYRFVIDLPTDVLVEPQKDGAVLLKRGETLAIRIDRKSSAFNLADQEELDVNHASTFFGSELEPALRFQFDKQEKGDVRQLEGRLQPGKAGYAVHIAGKFTEAQMNEMVAILATARVNESIKLLEQKQEDAAVRLSQTKIAIRRQNGLPTLALDRPVSPELLPDLLSLIDLRGLAFYKYPFKDADLVPFAKIPFVENLLLEGPGISDKAFETIKQWKWLRELRLIGTQVIGTGFNDLRSAQYLQEVSISFGPFRNAGLQSLQGVPLEKITLNTTDITDSGVAFLSQIPTLRTITLIDNRVEGKAIEGLSKMPELKSLAFIACPLDAAAFKAIAGCVKLESLAFGNIALGTSDLSWLGSLKDLESLSFFDTDMTAKSLQTLAAGPALKTLQIRDVNLPEAELLAFEKKNANLKVQYPRPRAEPDLLGVLPPKPISELPAADPKKMIDTHKGQIKINEEAEGKPIVAVVLKNSQVSNLDLAELRSLNKLERLDLTNCPGVFDQGLAYIGELKNLQVLKLNGTSITGDGFGFLKDLKNLTTLELPNQNFTTKQLAPLMALPNLERINCLNGENLYFKLKNLEGLKNLKELDLTSPDMVGFDPLMFLPHFKKLESLKVNNPASRSLPKVGELVELRTLQMTGIYYSRLDQWRPLSNLKELRELTISSGMLDDTKLVVLRELSNLEKLHLNCPRLTDKGIGRVRDYGKLRDLSLADCGISDATLESIGDMKELEELDLTGTQITDAGLAKLKEMEELRNLKIGNDKLTGKGLNELRSLKRIRTLQLSDMKFVDGTAEAIRGLNGLIEVHLLGCSLKSSDVEKILGLPELRRLTLPTLIETEQAKVDEIVKKYPKVKIVVQ